MRLKAFFAALAAGVSCVLADGPATGPATKPSTRPSTRPAIVRPAATRPAKQVDPLKQAILELQREAQTALSAKKPFPRTSSDYFPQSGTIDADALLKALSGPIHQNPRIDAYVKLQLLSAVDNFSSEKALPALKAYVLGSPALIALPGLTQQEQQKLNQKAMNAKREEVATINEEWKKQLAPYIDANQIILDYRELMKSKIQPPEELKQRFFHAQLEDLSQRGAAGYEIDKDLNSLTKSILSWAPLAKKAQLKEMQSALKEYAARKPGKAYEELSWNSRKDEATWKYHYAGLPMTKVDKLLEQITEAIPNAIE